MGLVVVLVALTSFRVTRLLTRDSFPPIAVQRARVIAKVGEEHWLAYLVECQWCAGVYVSGALTGAAWWVLDDLPVPAFVWGAAAAIVGILAVLVEALDKAGDWLQVVIDKANEE